jgi:hypothetical protein
VAHEAHFHLGPSGPLARHQHEPPFPPSLGNPSPGALVYLCVYVCVCVCV